MKYRKEKCEIMAKFFDSSKKKMSGVLLIFVAIIILVAVIWILIRNTPGNEYIGATKAEDIALQDARVLREDVTYIKSYMDTDNQIKVYEVEFSDGAFEYDYEINAGNGAIVDKDYEKIERDRKVR